MKQNVKWENLTENYYCDQAGDFWNKCSANMQKIPVRNRSIGNSSSLIANQVKRFTHDDFSSSFSGYFSHLTGSIYDA